MALLTHYHKSYLGFVETGSRRATKGFVESYERVLGIEIEFLEDDGMQRRALLVALAAGAVSPGLLIETVRRSLVSAGGVRATVNDWHEIAEEYGRRFMNHDLNLSGRDLTTDLLFVQSAWTIRA